MGYCMQQEETRFAIRAENMKHAFGQLQALAARAGAHRRGHFAWVDTSTLLSAKSVQEHLAEWRWDPELDADGNIVGLDFTGEKLGDDMELFKALAPYVERGSFIRMSGEDGELWRWFFDGTSCVEQTPTVSFDDHLPEVIDVLPGPAGLLR